MDSLTQAALGAAIGGAIAPAGSRRKGLVAGAMLGTLPDLDVFIDFGGAVENFTFHRGFSHSLIVLTPLSVLLWLALRRWWAPVREAPRPWFAIINLVLITHVLLDAHTAYGTQLFWPFEPNPTKWATLFIIDPVYTIPLVIGSIITAIVPKKRLGAYAVRSGLALSVVYIAWSWVAQDLVRSNVETVLAETGLEGAPVFITPTPFNTLLWRVVVLVEDGFLEGYDSVVVDDGPIRLTAYPSDAKALEGASEIWAVERLRWFAGDFVKATVVDDQLVIDDLRMGGEPNYVFTHKVASRVGAQWQPVRTELLPVDFDRMVFEELWERIWAPQD